MSFFVHGGEKANINDNGAFGLAGANYGSAGQVLTSNGSGSELHGQAASGVKFKLFINNCYLGWFCICWTR